MAKEDTRDFGPAVAALSEHVKTDDKGNLTVGRPGYVDFMAKGGISKETVTAVQERHETMWGAMTELAGAKLVERIAEATAAGDDPRELVQTINVNVPGGSDVIEIKSYSVSPNPRFAEHGGAEKIVKIGQTSLKTRRKSALPSAPVTAMREAVTAALGSSVE